MAKHLTEKQLLFLDFLFGEAEGNAVKAKQLAGYSYDYNTNLLIKSVEDEILERTKRFLTQNGPKAAMSIVQVMDEPTQLGNQYKMGAAKDILDRIGISKSEKIEVTGGQFLLPPKEEG